MQPVSAFIAIHNLQLNSRCTAKLTLDITIKCMLNAFDSAVFQKRTVWFEHNRTTELFVNNLQRWMRMACECTTTAEQQ